MNRLMRRPKPDFTTAMATRNAITTNSTLALAKPAKAFAGEMVPVRTTAATASSADGSSGNEPISTDAIADANTANRCQAGGVNPAGTGVSQMPTASTNGNACFSDVRRRLMAEMCLRRTRSVSSEIALCR